VIRVRSPERRDRRDHAQGDVRRRRAREPDTSPVRLA
jgi:hypothetical protein